MRRSPTPSPNPALPVVRAALLAAVALLAPSAAAVTVDGVAVADTATVGGRALALNGVGVRMKVVFKVYVAALYTPAKATTLAAVTSGPRRVQMTMLRTVAADALVEAMHEGLVANSGAATLAAVKAEADAFSGILQGFGELKQGAVVALDFADGKTTVTLNGAARGTIAGEAFNAAMLRIWLGDHPVQDDLKQGLLGG